MKLLYIIYENTSHQGGTIMLMFAKQLLIEDKDFRTTLAFFGSAMLDKVFFLMGGMYFFYWFGNLFSSTFDNDYGNFFENIGMLLTVYLMTVICSWTGKVVSSKIFTPIGFAFLTYLLAFPMLGEFISVILAVFIGIFCILKKPDATILTSSLFGYWVLLFFVSAADYSLFEAISEGIIPTIIEVWTITWNAASYTVYDQAFSGVGGILVLVFGILSTRLLNGDFVLPSFNERKEKEKMRFEELEELAKSKQDVKLKNAKVFNETIDERVKERLQNKKIEDCPASKEEVQIQGIIEEKKEVKIEPKEKPLKPKLTSKAFFNVRVPSVKVKINKLVEKQLRRLAK